ncbi:MAG: quinolinate synthase NadA [Coriobacteriales bacterium]|nr:quinolinate synthase NadA [Coriobacteriales bacterium]
MLSKELLEEFYDLKSKRDAIVLAHYYVQGDAQDLADYVGDSYFLAQKAATIDCKTLVFAGVEFMAESAKLLSPNKRVLMPEPSADCPMAHMLRKQTIDEAREKYGDDLAVVCYVNSTNEMKAWSDVCVTSSNAQRIVERMPQHHILFVPDQHLGHYIQEQVPSKHILLNDGFCPTHEAIELSEVLAVKEEHPDAVVCAHPECAAWVLEHADFIGSTSQIIDRCVQGTETDYVICTVHGVLHEIKKQVAAAGDAHNKRFHFPQTTPICPNMARITGEKVVACLRDLSGEVFVDEQHAAGARKALELMLELAK